MLTPDGKKNGSLRFDQQPAPGEDDHRLPFARLDGWKDIAEYLDRDIRTCQRWALNLGLPVRKIDADSNRGKVFAFQSELDDWLKSRNANGFESQKSPEGKKQSRKRPVRIASLVAGLAVIGFLVMTGLWLIGRRTGGGSLGPVLCEVRGQSLVFFDSAYKALWNVPVDLPKNINEFGFGPGNTNLPPLEAFSRYCVDFADVDGDGRNEAAVFILDRNPAKRTIVLFDDNGKKISTWKNPAPYPFRHPEGISSHDVYVRHMSFEKLPGRDGPSLFVLWIDKKFEPSSFMILDGKSGKELFTSDHIGNLIFYKYLEFTGRPLIFLGGTNNLAHNDAVCAVIDPAELQSGFGPPYVPENQFDVAVSGGFSGPPDGTPPSGQVQYIKFLRTPLSERNDVKWMWATDATVDGDRFYITVQFAPDSNLLYFFDREFRFLEVRAGADFRRNYESWRRQGKVKEPIEEYLSRRGKDISYWDGTRWSPDPAAR